MKATIISGGVTMNRMWMWAALLAAGCATMGIGKKTTVDDERLARLPEQDKREIFEAQNAVTIASSNVATANAGKDEAKQFCKVADAELDAAKEVKKAADKGIELGRQAYSKETTDAARRSTKSATADVVAAQAKLDYCRSLVSARDAKIEAAEAEAQLARANAELTKVRALQKNNMDNALDQNPFLDAKRKAEHNLAQKKLEVEQKEKQTESLESTWQSRRRAAQSDPTAPTIRAPADPKPADVPMQPVR